MIPKHITYIILLTSCLLFSNCANYPPYSELGASSSIKEVAIVKEKFSNENLTRRSMHIVHVDGADIPKSMEYTLKPGLRNIKVVARVGGMYVNNPVPIEVHLTAGHTYRLEPIMKDVEVESYGFGPVPTTFKGSFIPVIIDETAEKIAFPQPST